MKDKPEILIVDDDQKALLLMEAVLKPHGYDVILINDGRQVIQTARKEKPDLILLDIMMPVLDGYSLLNKIKKEEANRTEEIYKALIVLEEASLETINRLAMVAEYRDEYTGSHIQRMGRYAAAVAQKLQIITTGSTRPSSTRRRCTIEAKQESPIRFCSSRASSTQKSGRL